MNRKLCLNIHPSEDRPTFFWTLLEKARIFGTFFDMDMKLIHPQDFRTSPCLEVAANHQSTQNRAEELTQCLQFVDWMAIEWTVLLFLLLPVGDAFPAERGLTGYHFHPILQHFLTQKA
jgi:hypothetical protein